MSLIQGTGGGLGGSGAPGGALAGGAVFSHTISKSLKLDDTSGSYLTISSASPTATNRKKVAISAWVKRALVSHSGVCTLFWGTVNGLMLQFFAADTIYIYDNNAGGWQSTVTGGGRLFRDIGAWYHLALIIDTTQSTDKDRAKFYVNGELQSLNSYPGLNTDITWHTGSTMRIGSVGDTQDLAGYVAEFISIDGQDVSISDFAETSGGVWVPKDVSGLTLGNAGFYLKFDDSSDIGNDSGSNNIDFTGTNLDASKVVLDTPTNNFAIINSLDNLNWVSQGTTNETIREGGLEFLSSSWMSRCTFPLDSGKWYWEVRKSTYMFTGLYYTDSASNNSKPAYQFYAGNVSSYNGSSDSVVYTSTVANGAIIGVEYDADNGTLEYYVNGSSIYKFTSLFAGQYTAVFGTAADSTSQVNFGQDPTFCNQLTGGDVGTQTDGNGKGLFKYAPSSGFLAICSANLADPAIGPGQDNQADDFFGTALYSGSDFNDLHVGTGGANRPIDTVSIANSLTFVRADEHELAKDFATSAGGPGAGNRRKWTFSTWIKRTRLSPSGNDHYIFGTRTGAADSTFMFLVFRLNDIVVTGQSTLWLRTDRTFKSTADWFHLVWVLDSDNSTNAEKMRLYIDGIELTSFSSDSRSSLSGDQPINAAVEHNIGRHPSSTGYGLDACLADTIFVDGQAYGPEQFGQVGSNGDWIPKTYSGTYGTTGFKLTYENSSYPGYDYQTSDRSGTTNDFNVIGSTIESHDVKIDTPTQNFNILNHETGGTAYDLLTEGGLQVTGGSGADIGGVASSLFMPAGVGKWYFEVLIKNPNNGDNYPYVGLAAYERLADNSTYGTKTRELSINLGKNATFSTNTTYVGTVNSTTTGVVKLENNDVLGVAVDMVNKKMWFSDNGTFFNSGDPANGTNRQLQWTNDIDLYPVFASYNNWGNDSIFNFGQDASFAGNKTAPTTAKTDANGFGNFLYDVPAGYLAMVDDNYAQEIPASPDWVWLKQRTASTKSHYLFDTVRGAGKDLHSDDNSAEATSEETLKSFDSQGFTIGTDTNINDRTENYVAWTWKAGGPAPTQTYTVTVSGDSGSNKYRFDGNTTDAPTLSLQQGGTYTFDQSDSSNALGGAPHPLRFSTTSDGTHGGGSEYTTGVTTTGTAGQTGAKTVITVPWGAPTLYYYCSSHSGMGGQVNTTKTRGSTNLRGDLTSIVSANTTAGFSIATFTMPDAQKTIGHGLGVKPEMIIFKLRSTGNWMVWHKSFGEDTNDVVLLDSTANKGDSGGSAGNWFRGLTTTVTEIKSAGAYAGTGDYVMYSFASVEGYSKIGLYVGNGLSDGTFVYTGFRPAWIMAKTVSGADRWILFDSERSPINPVEEKHELNPDDNSAEGTSGTDCFDFLSNGFKLRRTGNVFNTSGRNYIYMAFAEAPFKFANAR
jgi:hypothetical protein